MRPDYLFIRVLEACNANCFMCAFARSKDRYRFPADDLRVMLPRVRAQGIRYVRLTGGEPLVHREVVALVDAIRTAALRSSIITNGWFLERNLEALVAAGLDQVIVSIDGLRDTHDEIRRMAGLYDRATAGARAAGARGVLLRVNTVVGPHNFREMPVLRTVLEDLDVRQWELSSLKLERPLDWTPADIADVDAVVAQVYGGAAQLRPMGKVWCGESAAERERYFRTGITPRADARCRVVEHVRYLDARNGMLFPCSLVPHRPGAMDNGARAAPPSQFSVSGRGIERQARRLALEGPHVCTGCSATAAGYSNDLASGGGGDPWSF
jgi:cytosylglucuronate decarboxylase